MKTRFKVLALATAMLLPEISFTAKASDNPDEMVTVYAPVYRTINDGSTSYSVVKLKEHFVLIDQDGNIIRDLGNNVSARTPVYKVIKLPASALYPAQSGHSK